MNNNKWCLLWFILALFFSVLYGLTWAKAAERTAVFAWEFYGDQANVDGFRIYADDRVILDEISPAARTATITFDDTRYTGCYDFSITAYNVEGESEHSNTVEWCKKVIPATPLRFTLDMQ